MLPQHAQVSRQCTNWVSLALATRSGISTPALTDNIINTETVKLFNSPNIPFSHLLAQTPALPSVFDTPEFVLYDGTSEQQLSRPYWWHKTPLTTLTQHIMIKSLLRHNHAMTSLGHKNQRSTSCCVGRESQNFQQYYRYMQTKVKPASKDVT